MALWLCVYAKLSIRLCVCASVKSRYASIFISYQLTETGSGLNAQTHWIKRGRERETERQRETERTRECVEKWKGVLCCWCCCGMDFGAWIGHTMRRWAVRMNIVLLCKAFIDKTNQKKKWRRRKKNVLDHTTATWPPNRSDEPSWKWNSLSLNTHYWHLIVFRYWVADDNDNNNKVKLVGERKRERELTYRSLPLALEIIYAIWWCDSAWNVLVAHRRNKLFAHLTDEPEKEQKNSQNHQ